MKKLTLVFIAFLFSIPLCYAGKEHYSQRVNAASFSTNMVMTYVDPFRGVSGLNNQSSDAYVKVGFDTYFPEVFTGKYHYEFQLSIKRYNWNNSNSTTSTEILSISTDYIDGGIYENVSQFNFSGYDKIEVTIVKMTDKLTSTVLSNGSSMPGAVYLEAGAVVERYHNFIATAPAFSDLNHTEIDNISDGTTMADEIEIKWKYMVGAEEYELEYLFLQPLNKTGELGNAANINFTEEDFNLGATRIKTGQQHYQIPVLYNKCYLVYRIRGIGRGGSSYQYNVSGAWSSSVNSPSCTAGKLDCFHHLEIEVPTSSTSDFLKEKNWQLVTQYAEDGKRKDVVSYMDGSYRKRQMVTKSNSDNRSVIGETVYDYYGRPAINILPVPVVDPTGGTVESKSTLRYFEAFNQSSTSSGSAYSYTDFDVLSPSVCTSGPGSLSTTSGAGLYYSSQNGERDNENAYLPDALGYPFVQTEYMDDNTGRVKATSGPGSHMQIGTGRETQYIYSSVTQDEIDRLFGSDAGFSSFYRKQITVDPNGQVSVAYMTNKGQTVATALAGDVPSSFQPVLNSGGSALATVMAVPDVSIDLLNKTASPDPDDARDNNNINTEKDLLYYNGFTYNATQGDMAVNYTVNTIPFSFDCYSAGNYQQVYKLNLLVQDACGNQTTFTNGPDRVVGIESTTGGNSSASLSISLPAAAQGNYNITKQLEIDETKRGGYLEDYLNNAPCVLGLDDFIGSIDVTACDLSCQECVDAIPNDQGLSQAVIDELTRLCMEPCTYTSKCENIFLMLLEDVSPNGQYGQNSGDNMEVSVFAEECLLPHGLSLSSAAWKNPEFHTNATLTDYYEDDLATPSTINVVNGIPVNDNNIQNGTVSPKELTYLEDFLANWKPSWAYSLVIYHPEYCSKSVCDDIASEKYSVSSTLINSEDYDFMIASTETYDDAISVTVLNGTGTINLTSGNVLINNDPFFKNSNLGSSYYTEALNKMNNYATVNGTSKNIYQFAAYLAECGNWYGKDINTSCNPTFGTGSGAVRNQQWNTLKGLYLGLRELYISKFFDGCTSDCYSGCIGEEEFYMYNSSIPQSSCAKPWIKWETTKYVNWWPSTFTPLIITFPDYFFNQTTFQSQAFKKEQPCSYFSSSYYSDKIRRYPSAYNFESSGDGGTGKDENETNYRIYEETGMCPLSFDLKTLLEDIGKSGNMTNQGAVHIYPSYTKRLYGLLLNNGPGLGSHSTIEDYIQNENLEQFLWDPIYSGSNNNLLTADLQGSCDIQLTLETLSWSDYGSAWTIDRVRQFQIDDVNISGTDFSLEIVTGNGYKEVIKGFTCLIITDCNAASFGTVPKTSDDLRNLKSLMNALLIPNASAGTYFTNNLTTSPITPSDLYGTTSPNSNFGQIFNTYLKGQVTLNDPAEEWIWEATESSTNNIPENYFYIKDRQSVSNLGYKITFCSAPSGTGYNEGWYSLSYFKSLVPTDGTNCSGCGSITPNFVAEVLDLSGGNPQLICGRLELINGSTALGPVNTGTITYPGNDQYGCNEPNQVMSLYMENFMSQLDIYYNDQNSGTPQQVEFSGTSNINMNIPLALRIGLLQSWSIPKNLVQVKDHITSPTYVDVYFDTHMIPNPENTGTDDISAPFCPTRLEIIEGAPVGDIINVETLSDLYVDESTISADGEFHHFYMIGTLQGSGDKVIVRGYNECIDFQNCIDCIAPSTAPLSSCQLTAADYTANFEVSLEFPAISEQDFCDYDLANGYTAYLEYGTYIYQQVGTSSPHFIDLKTFVINGLHKYWLAYKDLFSIPSFNFPSTTDPNYITLWELAQMAPGGDCIDAYKNAYNASTNAITFQNFHTYCKPYYYCSPLPVDEFPDLTVHNTGNPCDSGLYHIEIANGMAAYLEYLEGVKSAFRIAYNEHFADNTIETLNLVRDEQEYHHTLYYYDQAGNLVRTVPPAGVNLLSSSQVTQVKTDRENGTKTVFTDHDLETTYEYNSFGQLIKQTTPDGGTTQFWYDGIGRLKASQNAEQYTNDQYSYTRFDEQGRIIETGQLEASTVPTNYLDDNNFPVNWEISNTRTQVVRSFYDKVVLTAPASYYGSFQTYLRNRVSASAYYENYSGNDQGYEHATHYSYDVHGNVNILIKDKPSNFEFDKQRFKKMTYEYDLVSGNVNRFIYQPGSWDQFIHQYSYDANNRIVNVQTSQDGYHWDTDGRYQYYLHGPLARTEIGEQQVQGLDYAYTLQGWLKAINSGTLSTMRDVGKDGLADENHLHRYFANDAMAQTLGYNSQDYASVSSYGNSFDLNPKVSGSTMGSASPDLYNGNIAYATVGLRETSENMMRHQGYSYAYDQLNRLVGMNMYHKHNGTTDEVQLNNSFDGAGNASDEYNTAYSYDQNGNILSLDRNGGGSGLTAMDDLTYSYYANTNRLRQVRDAVSSGNYTTDIDDQAYEYVYDNIGNLTSDKNEEILNINWTVSGKISEILRTNGSTKSDLAFEYDALGNRITKIEKPRPGGTPSVFMEWITTHYVRDAQGNVLAVYTEKYKNCECAEEPQGEEDCRCDAGGFVDCECTEVSEEFVAGTDFNYISELELKELMIYGSDRLGILKPGETEWTLENITSEGGEYMVEIIGIEEKGLSLTYRDHTAGLRNYELKNHLGNVYTSISDARLYETSDELKHFQDFSDEQVGSEWVGAGQGSLQTQLSIVDEELLVQTTYQANTPPNPPSSFGNAILKKNLEGGGESYTITYDLGSYSGSGALPYPGQVKMRIEDRTDPNNIGVINAGAIQLQGNNTETFTISTSGTREIWIMILVPYSYRTQALHYTIDNILLLHEDGAYNYVADVLNTQDYYPFGSIMPGRIFNAGDYRYGFNGMEQDDEMKGNSNSLDFGARIYDPRIGKFLSLDPLASQFPSESNYSYASDNPIFFIDVDGKYRWPASKEAEYTKKYPMITKYLSENVKSDVLNSAPIKHAFEVTTRADATTLKDVDQPQTGYLQGEVLEKTVSWGKGPEILISDTPGNTPFGDALRGFYDKDGKLIEINTDILNEVEAILQSDASEEEKQQALLNFTTTLLHETVHYGEDMDGRETTSYKNGTVEEGGLFENMVWGEKIEDNGEIYFQNSDDKTTEEGRAAIQERKSQTEEGKSTLPTVPK